MRMKSKKQLTLALALTLALGGSVPVWAEHIQDKTLTKGDWTLGEELYMEKSHIHSGPGFPGWQQRPCRQ